MIKVAAAVIVSDGKILAAKRKNERLGGRLLGISWW